MAQTNYTNYAAASVGTPASGVTSVFVDTSGKTLKSRDDTGTLTTYISTGANTFTGIQTITNITLPTNGQILETVPTSDGHATGETTSSYNSGYSSTAVGDLVYLDSSATWQKCDMNTSATTYGSGPLGIALAVAASGNPVLVLLRGFVYATAFPTFTIGAPVYMSDGGAVQVAQPSAANDAIRVVGYGVHADKMYFNPSNDYIVHV